MTDSPTTGTTRTLVLPGDLAPVQILGARDEVLRAVEKGFPDVDIHVRGTAVTVSGQAPRVDTVMVLLSELIDVARTGTPLGADAVERAISLLEAAARPVEVLAEDVLTARGRTIRPKSLGQKAYTDAIEESTITFGVGPAGTGKTYLAMAKAVDALARQQVSRIILTRPAVEAGESLGFLPGSLTDKIDPYLRPLYDALHDMLEPQALPRLMAAGTIEVAPLAYMRGRTLNDAFVILDEAQNTTPEQMKMFLTRLGFGSKMVVTGDTSQVDLPGAAPAGSSWYGVSFRTWRGCASASSARPTSCATAWWAALSRPTPATTPRRPPWRRGRAGATAGAATVPGPAPATSPPQP